jgi:hypothetical protein
MDEVLPLHKKRQVQQGVREARTATTNTIRLVRGGNGRGGELEEGEVWVCGCTA